MFVSECEADALYLPISQFGDKFSTGMRDGAKKLLKIVDNGKLHTSPTSSGFNFSRIPTHWCGKTVLNILVLLLSGGVYFLRFYVVFRPQRELGGFR